MSINEVDVAAGRRLLNVDEACAVLGGISRATVYRLAASGRLHVVKIGRGTYITSDEVERFIDALVAAGSVPDSAVSPTYRRVRRS